MARLNTKNQTKQSEPRERTRPQGQLERHAQSPPPPTLNERRREQWTMTTRETSLFNKRAPGLPERPPPPLVRSNSTRTRVKTVSEQQFDIFADSDGTSERDTPKAKKATPLKLGLARANSMILPLPTARSRTSRKSELYNYDKENDPAEEELDPEPTSLSRNPSDASSTRRSPTRNRNTQQFTAYRQPQPQPESEDENDQDDSFNSLDDFIVSDNDEHSYTETTDDETEEEEHKVSPPPTQRRKLFRGRRPNPTDELENALRESLQRPDIRLQPSLPASITIPSPNPDRIARRLFQKEADVSEKMVRLKLEDNDPSSQLQFDIFGAATELESRSPPPQQRNDSTFRTPPSSPSKSLLRSPTKDKVRIPPTPHCESADAFWSIEATNNWIDEHSPRKVNILLQEFDESDCDSTMSIRSGTKTKPKPPSKTALKKAETEAKKAALARKKSFDGRKAAFAETFFKVLDDAVSGGEVQRRSADTGGVRIVWSKTLQTTAGRASWKRDRSTADSSSLRSSSSSNETPPLSSTKNFATIELAERIIDDEDRLISTLAHEYCHLANYMVSNVRNQPHGASFQAWGRKCKEALKDHHVYGGRIEVTTRHSYKIDYKYVWTCVDCCQNYGRHSKSIDPNKHRCGKCKGLLQQIKPKPRSVSPRKKQPPVSAVTDMTKGLEVVNLSP
ncbi:SprT-like family-domain-containing protein [Aspergillus cavernicola]|uniref:SprT-like family-domain-containing protein n=1 Tax=Aspergillus cavernicola TaxID=176166 RepID=A0ABR4IQ23_9EURO